MSSSTISSSTISPSTISSSTKSSSTISSSTISSSSTTTTATANNNNSQLTQGESAGFRFNDLVAELRSQIWEEALLDAANHRRVILLGEPSFRLSPNTRRAPGPSDLKRIKNLRAASEEAESCFFRMIQADRLQVPPTSCVRTFPDSEEWAAASAAREGFFEISAKNDILYLDGELVQQHIQQFVEGYNVNYSRAPWHTRRSEECPVQFMMDLTNGLSLLESAPHAKPGDPYHGTKSTQAFLLSLGITAPFLPSMTPQERATPRSWTREIVGRRNWRELRMEPTTVTIVIPVYEGDSAGADIDMNSVVGNGVFRGKGEGPEQMLHVQAYDGNGHGASEVWQLADSILQRGQLARVMLAWDLLVNNAERQFIRFPVRLQFLRRGPRPAG